jgi:hypothetical protein
VRRPLRAEVVEPDEVSELVVSDVGVTMRTVDKRDLRLPVLDPEGFAETIMEPWGPGLSGKCCRIFGKAVDPGRIRLHRIAVMAGVTLAATAASRTSPKLVLRGWRCSR